MKQIRVIDGGFGTQISQKINQKIDGDPLWSARLLLTNKEDVINTHLDFLRAGSDVIETNTYQASIDGFSKYLDLNRDECYNLIKEGVKLAKKARNIYNTDNTREILIAGSLGPYGACLHDGSEYTGSYKDTVSSISLKEFHTPRISALVEAGADLLAFETLPCKKEAEVLLSILKLFPNVKAWLSFNCKDEISIASGENFQATIQECYQLNRDQLVAVGANCISPKFVEKLFSGINNENSEPIPLIVYPNSGEYYSINDGWFGLENCRPISTYVDQWLDLGITWIGGCCRMTANQIAKIKEAVKDWEAKHL